MKTLYILVALPMLFLSQLSHSQDECKTIGWATFDGDTYAGAPTGGGNLAPVEVSTFAELKSAAESSSAKVIYVKNSVGNGYSGTTGDVLYVKSNKTIIGYPGVTVKCSWQIKSVSNIIIRNMTLSGPGNSNSNQNWDCVNIQGASRIWFDHCTVMDGEDGNFDVVKGSDNISVTWCIFTYSADGAHNLSNLIGSSDTESVSHTKLNVTYAYCWWKNVNSRTPRSRYGKIHVLNCYYSNSGGTRAGFMANQRVEGCYFDGISEPIGLISDGGQAGIFPLNCEFVNCSGNKSAVSVGGYTVFTPPYSYTMLPAKNIKSIVTNTACGAGPTMDSPTQCGCNLPTNPSLELSSGSSIQTVTLGSPISQLIYTWGGSATDVTISGLPAGLITTKNSLAKTLTISGTPTATDTYTITTVQSSGAAVSLSGTVTVKVPVPQAPYGGSPHPIPGTVQFEDFDVGGNGFAYLDLTPGSEVPSAPAFRSDEDVDIEVCGDTDGGYSLGYTAAGEWLEYTVDVASQGSYNIDLRVACNADGRTVSIEIGGAMIAADVAVPNTGGWQTYQTISVADVALSAGVQIMKVTIGALDYVNLNYASFTKGKDCSGVDGGSAFTDKCGQCVGGSTGKAACREEKAQAEDVSCGFPGIVEAKNAGFEGTGYVNVDNAANTSLTINVVAGESADVTLGIQYANGGTADRPAQVLVNGIEAVASFSMPVTSWASYTSVETSISLNAGVNRITLIALSGDGFANFDFYYLYGDARFAGCDAEQSVELSEGWNLFSVNVMPSAASAGSQPQTWLVSSLFAGLDVAEIKSMDAFWRADQPEQFNSLAAIVPGQGYMVKMNAKGMLALSGTPMVDTEGALSLQKSGWKLIGCPFPSAVPFSELFDASDCGTVKDFDGYWMPDGTGNSIDMLEPGKAYFVK